VKQTVSFPFEPPTVDEGTPCPFVNPEIYPGVRGYAIEHNGEIWIPLVEGGHNGQVGKFLDDLSYRCRIVNVCSPILEGMLKRRGWISVLDEEGCDIWRKPLPHEIPEVSA
jgi:hypothetical protein